MFAAQWIVACAVIGQVVVPPVPVAPIPVKKFGFTGTPTAAVSQAATAATTPAGKEAVTTIHDERVEGSIDGFENGQIVLGTEPPRKVPLDEVDRLDFMPRLKPGESPPDNVSLIWYGQDNHDLAQAGGIPGGNGIQDIHLQCRGLAPGRKLKQVVVFANQPEGETKIWAIDPGTSNFWRMQSQQVAGETMVDLYLEPPAGDCFDQVWEAWLTTEDNRTVKTRVRASTHTDNTLRVGADAAPVVAGSPLATVLVEGDNTIRGDIIGLDEDSLSLKTNWDEALKIPLVQVRACWFGGQRPEMLAAQLNKRGETDWVLFKTRENTPTVIDGALKGLADGKLELNVAGESRKVAADRLMGFVLAVRPPQPRPVSFYQVFELRDGQKISGRLGEVKSESIELTTLWNAALSVPRLHLKTITCHNGKVVYLSDLEPAAVEEVSYFGRPRPYRRDQNLEGSPLAVKGIVYRKGLAVHSRSVLVFALAGHYSKFQTTLGFDDAAPPGGSVACRVLADDRELYANPKLRQTGSAVALNLSVEGAKQLVLEVDFGESEDIGDRVIWAGARLLRAQPVAQDGQAKDEKPNSSGTKE